MTAVLGVSGLHAGYGPSIVLRDVSFEVSPGEVACLMGRNGAGTLAGLLKESLKKPRPHKRTKVLS